MENNLNTQVANAKSKAAIIQSIVVAFAITYGIHYFGFFLRVRYFNFIDWVDTGAAWNHVFMYCGHSIFLVLLLLYALAVKNDRKYILAFLPSRGNKNLKWLLLGAATGFVMMGTCILAAKLHGDITINHGSGGHFGIFIVAFLAVFLQASTEEIESRAFLFGKMKGEGVPVAAAILISSFFFGYLHAANPGFGLIPMFSIFVVGLLYALSYHYFGNIWFTCGAHTLWNFTQDFIFGLPDSGKPAAVSIMDTTVNGSSFFYDTDFGIEGSFMAIGVNLLACVVVFLIGRRINAKDYQ